MTHANTLPEDASDTARILALLERMDARLTRLESTVSALADQAPGLTAAAVDTIDAALARLAETGVDVDERVHNSISTLEVATRPETLRLLQRVVDRSGDIEAVLDVLPQAPGLAAAAVDTVDGALARIAAQGIDVDARLRTALDLVEKLTRPEVACQLSEAMAQLDALPGLIAAAADTFDGITGQLGADGVDLDARVRSGLRTLELLTRPEVTDLIEQSIPQLLELPGMAAAAADTLDGVIGRMYSHGIQVDDRLQALTRAAEVMTRPETVGLVNMLMSRSEELAGLTQTLLESGVFAQESANLVGNTGDALVATRKEPNGALGLFGLMRSLRDPNIQRAASFGIRFAQRFGQMLETPIDECLGRDAQAQAK